MAQEIRSSKVNGEFAPSVDLIKEGDYVKGKIVSIRSMPKDRWGHIKPVISLQLIDMEGDTTRPGAVPKERISVVVAEGDLVDLIGNGTDLMDKLSQVKVGQIITVTKQGKKDTGKGNPLQLYKVLVD